MLVFVGTFTDGFAAGARADGVSVFDLDENTGALTHRHTFPGLNNPSFVAVHPRLPVLYAVERFVPPQRRAKTEEEMKKSTLTVLAIDRASGALRMIERLPAGGEGPAHVSVHPSGSHIFVVNPGTGHVVARPLGADGRPGEICASVRHEGRGPNKVRQATAYPHATFIHPAGDLAFVCDLGLDRTMIYRFDRARGALTPGAQPFIQASSGSGPRHLAFHPNGRFVFILNELDCTVSAFAFDPASGAASIIHTLSINPPGFKGHRSGAEILLGPANRFLYCSSRTNNTIAVYTVDPQSGELAPIAYEPTLGDTPRNFNFTPSGRMLVTANQVSGSLVSFRVDAATGRLTPTGHSAATPSPVCVAFG